MKQYKFETKSVTGKVGLEIVCYAYVDNQGNFVENPNIEKDKQILAAVHWLGDEVTEEIKNHIIKACEKERAKYLKNDN